MFTCPCSIAQVKRNACIANVANRSCRLPLINAFNTLATFLCLPLEFLIECVETYIRDFTSPEAFHTLKVQRLGDNVVKLTTQVSGAFIVPISALVGDLAIKSCQLSDGTPPVTRTLLLATHGFVEFAELVQGLFQGLWSSFVKCGCRRYLPAYLP